MEVKNYFATDTQGNVLGSAQVYLYLAGTTTLATGLQNISGASLANPFTSQANGLVQFKAPDANYDLRVVKPGREFTIRIQCFDGIAFLSEAISTTPSALKIPVANSSGTLDIGWLPSPISSIVSDYEQQVAIGPIRPEWYGADVYGVADSSSAIQAAVDLASSISSTYGRPCKVELTGKLKVSPQFYHTLTDWRHCILVNGNNIQIVSNGCQIVTSINFSTRSLVFMVRGDNNRFVGIDFYDVTTAPTHSFAIGIGGGSSYDGGIEKNRTYKNSSVVQCTSKNLWQTASFQMGVLDDGTTILDGILYDRCYSEARPGNTTSGNFNVRSDPPGKVRNARMLSCVAKNGATASSFNVVGVDTFSVVDCESELNLYGACEIENGSKNGFVGNLKSRNDVIGLWIDDSSDVCADGINMVNTIPTLVSPLLGTFGLNRNAVRVTKQGFPGYPSYNVTGLTISNVIGTNASISCASFGTQEPGGAATFGNISIDGFSINNDGLAESGGRAVFFSPVPMMTMRNGVIIGAATEQVTGASSGGNVIIDNVKCYAKSTESPAGLNIIGTSAISLKDSIFSSYVALPSGERTEINCQSGSTLRPNRLRGDTTVSRLTVSAPMNIAQYTLATLPSASAFPGSMILVSNASGGPKFCVSNGGLWQIINTATTVS